MAIPPPPRPLTSEEFAERWNAGARTLFEIDPELGRWHRRCQRIIAFQVAGITLSLLIGAGILLMDMWR